VGYNVQTAVEARHHLIVAHEVTNHGYDRDALSMMAVSARDAMACDELEAIADKGYYKGEEIVACEADGITATVAKPMTSGASARGRFDRADFAYDADRDVYVCPAGQDLPYRFTNQEAGKTLHSYWSSFCSGCAIKNRCTPSKERRIRRWQHEGVLERMQKRIDDNPDRLAIRSMTVEHPFGSIKS
ncbi:MAG: IS5/IS1182 family transposase, partial [bacterium]|nr:IS5/IS1182 family transposase [bacterium]